MGRVVGAEALALEVHMSRKLALILADHQVLDLSIVEPDIEDVIRRIYRGETRPGETRPPGQGR